MCGIAGIVSWCNENNLNEMVDKMCATLVHRGPDDQGIWCDGDAGVGFGQRRLSIIDLSPHGHQPMISVSGRWIISFNGEIYNFKELRKNLEDESKSPIWRGHSDTEVMLACIEAWGVEKALKKTVGMFAIALWDRKEKALILARDRMGEKPLYYGVVDGRVAFSSELKAINAVSDRMEIDLNSLSSFFRFSYIPAPKSIWKNFYKLSPGSFIKLKCAADVLRSPVYFWGLDSSSNEKITKKYDGLDDKNAIDLIESRLDDAIRLQMVADVPLGAFLSGGVDSSTVVALMQKHSTRPVRTFTIGFDQPQFNEAPFAKEVAQHLGTDHAELYISGRDAEDLIPKLPSIYDEPFGDSSQIPTTLVSQLTKKHVTVSLSGDGGDELFAGYPRYQMTSSVWGKMERLPFPLKKALSVLIENISANSWDMIISVLPVAYRQNFNGHRLHRLARLLVTQSLGEMYLRLMSQWQPEDELVLGLARGPFDLSNWKSELPALDAMRRWDVQQYLSDDLLVKVDRASMSASLETRAPILDHRVAEIAFAMPDKFLIRDGVNKWILRQVLYRYVPKHLIERPKTGFSVPLGAWLRGPLRPWGESLLDSMRVSTSHMIDSDKVMKLWQDHLSGKFDRSSYLWNVFMFQAWYINNKNT